MIPPNERPHRASKEDEGEQDTGGEEEPDLGELPSAAEEEEKGGPRGCAAPRGSLHLGRRVGKDGTVAEVQGSVRRSTSCHRHRCSHSAGAR